MSLIINFYTLTALGVAFGNADCRTFRFGSKGLVETDKSRDRIHKARKQAKEAAEKAIRQRYMSQTRLSDCV
jgi:hypothetical protein